MDDSQSNLRKGQHRVLTGAEDAPQPLLSSAESITQHPDEFRESTFRQRVANLSELEAYKYDYIQSRRHIRVLTLHPGSGDEEIFCSLVAARLDEPPPYEALSYAWGNPNERHSIRCDNGKFDVTVNLFAALKRLRDISVERLLWIDAICINQKDEIEKGAQVQQMAEIYSSATRVLIWFGEATKSVPAAFEAIRWTRTLFPEQGALATLGSRPWFMRKWVIQEVVRGQHGLIVCGSHTLPWDVFEDTFTYMKML
ncbi:HET-domain-containing protein, partial [Cadophora sp. DSE1049]